VAGRDVAVTEDDLEAISWIAAHVPAGAVVANRYGDAGLAPFSIADVRAAHDRFAEIHSRGGAAVFEVLPQPIRAAGTDPGS
jgi:hypothetical protein